MACTQVTYNQAHGMACHLLVEDGLMVGISGGAVVFAASEVAKRIENKGKTLVVDVTSFGGYAIFQGLLVLYGRMFTI